MNSGEDSAFPMVSSSTSASHKYEGTASCRWTRPGRSLQKSPSSRSCRAWAHNLCEERILPGGQDSSVGGGAVVNCHGVVHMEKEVQDRVQVEVGREEQGVGETHGKEQSEEQRENRRSIDRSTWMTLGWCAHAQS